MRDVFKDVLTFLKVKKVFSLVEKNITNIFSRVTVQFLISKVNGRIFFSFEKQFLHLKVLLDALGPLKKVLTSVDILTDFFEERKKNLPKLEFTYLYLLQTHKLISNKMSVIEKFLIFHLFHIEK